MATNPLDLKDAEDFLNTDQNDRAQDINNSDAGKFTEDAEEDALLAEGNLSSGPDGEQFAEPNPDAGPPLTTVGTTDEIKENMGGTSNLSLDQLKHNHHPED